MLLFSPSQSRLTALEQELSCLAHDKLKDKGRMLVECFVNKLQLLLRGTATASPEKFGETLEEEQIRAGEWRPEV
jgi:hypothetical protein